MSARLAGLSDAETAALRTIFALAPWGRSRISRLTADYLDGRNPGALDATPTLKKKIDEAAAVIRAGAKGGL